MSKQIMVSKRAGRLGVSCMDAPDGAGAVCSSLIEGSTARLAGLNVGDCITAVNGSLIAGHHDCIAAIDAAPDRVAFVLARPSRRVMLDKASGGRIGITLSTPHTGFGTLVSALEEHSLGFDAGLFVGDTILSVNGVLANSHEEAVELIDAARVAELVVVATTREISINKRESDPTAAVGLTVADRVDRGAGVVVIGLEPGGLAIRQLQLGDTILSVNGELVGSHAEAISRVDAARGHFSVVVSNEPVDLASVLNSVHRSSSLAAGVSIVSAPATSL